MGAHRGFDEAARVFGPLQQRRIVRRSQRLDRYFNARERVLVTLQGLESDGFVNHRLRPIFGHCFARINRQRGVVAGSSFATPLGEFAFLIVTET